jgi:hypothetical protein
MNFSKFALAGILISGMLTFQSCNNDDDNNDDNNPPAELKGDMEIEFDHVWGPALAPFDLNTELIHPATSEAITFTRLRYYITNIRLHKTDGTTWTEEESYHIVDASAARAHINLSDLPGGEYNGMTFLIGVDSLRNTSGAQTGALDPAENMFWSWNSGYIFVKAEGTSPAATNETFIYHIGGFQGPNNAIREVHLHFDDLNLRIAPNALPVAHLTVNAARFWHGGISLADMSNVHMPGANASTLATNFSGGFLLDHIHN